MMFRDDFYHMHNYPSHNDLNTLTIIKYLLIYKYVQTNLTKKQVEKKLLCD